MVTVGVGPPAPPERLFLSSATSQHCIKEKEQAEPKIVYFAAHSFKLSRFKSNLPGGQRVNLQECNTINQTNVAPDIQW